MSTADITALSYYHPWFGGGAHRPRQLMIADLARGVDAAFVFSSPTGIDEVRAELASDPDWQGRVYHLLESGDSVRRLGVTPDRDERLTVDELLPHRPGPGYVRVHNPAADLLPVFDAAIGKGLTTVYDQMDHWSGFGVQPWGDFSIEEQYLRRASVVITITDELAGLCPDGVRAHAIPNGVNDTFVRQLRETPPGPPGRRRALYAGAMWPDWFDWELVLAVTESVPDVEFTFIGGLDATPDEDDGRPIRLFGDRLRGRPNVVLLDEVPHADMVTHLAAADVGLVPFIANDVTHPCSPLKVFEYLAAGLPVVSSPLRNLIGLPGIHTADRAAGWPAALEQAFADAADLQARSTRLKFAQDSTWSARADEFDRIVRQAR